MAWEHLWKWLASYCKFKKNNDQESFVQYFQHKKPQFLKTSTKMYSAYSILRIEIMLLGRKNQTYCDWFICLNVLRFIPNASFLKFGVIDCKRLTLSLRTMQLRKNRHLVSIRQPQNSKISEGISKMIWQNFSLLPLVWAFIPHSF